MVDFSEAKLLEEGGLKVAFFDFDGTLVQKGTMVFWLAAVTSWPKLITALLAAMVVWVAALFKNKHTRQKDILKTGFKALLLQYTLQGIPVDSPRIALATAKLQNELRPYKTVLAKMDEHHREGCRIVVASGALRVYLEAILKTFGWPVIDIIATDLEVLNGHFTGKMAGGDMGNMVRHIKGNVVQTYLTDHNILPLNAIAYGNLPDDQEMLESVGVAIVVTGVDETVKMTRVFFDQDSPCKKVVIPG